MIENKIRQVMYEKGEIYDVSYSSVIQRLLFVTDSTIVEYDTISNSVTWQYEYCVYFSKELLNIPWNTKSVVSQPINYLGMWVVLFNKRYVLIIGGSQFMSNLITIDSRLSNFEFLPRHLGFSGLKEDRKQVRIWDIDMMDLYAQVLLNN